MLYEIQACEDMTAPKNKIGKESAVWVISSSNKSISARPYALNQIIKPSHILIGLSYLLNGCSMEAFASRQENCPKENDTRIKAGKDYDLPKP